MAHKELLSILLFVQLSGNTHTLAAGYGALVGAIITATSTLFPLSRIHVGICRNSIKVRNSLFIQGEFPDLLFHFYSIYHSKIALAFFCTPACIISTRICIIARMTFVGTATGI